MDNKDREIELLKKAYIREKIARKEAERILEIKALELFNTNQELQILNENLEKNLEERVKEIRVMANFYFQNPNPVLRINKTFDVLFRNEMGLSIIAEISQNREQRDYSFFRKAITDSLKSKEEITLISELGNQYFQLTFIPFSEEDYVNIYGLDITKQILAEQAQKNSESSFRNYIETAEDIIYQTDLKGNITYVNQSVQKFTGYEPSEFINQNIQKFISENTLLAANQIYLDQIRQNKSSSYFEFEFITKSGKKKWLGQKAQILIENEKNVGFLIFARDIHENKVLQSAIKFSEEKYRGIMENLELGLIEVNNDGIITKAYESFCTLTGYSNEELIGLNPNKFLLHPDSLSQMRRVEKLRNIGQTSVYEVQLKHKKGHYIWTIISGAPYYDLEGIQIGTIGIHVDISERKKLETDLKAAKEIAQASSKAKEMFLANMSHEIRTPLNAVIGIGQILAKTPLNQKQNGLLSKIQVSANSLLLLVNDILDLTKIESGEMTLNNIPNNLNECIKEIVDTMNFSALKKDLDLVFESINLKSDSWYKFDKLRLSQILINLISNAIKFTESGKVIVKCTVLNENKSELIKLEIIDSGIGITPEKLETIFDEFQQANADTTRKYGGTGLGLSISKTLVRLFNSQLKVKSKLHQGSNFNFELKLENSKKPLFEESKERIGSLKNIKFLMAEDNEFNQFVAENMISDWGAQVKTFSNGKLLIDYLQGDSVEPYDLILMDIQMPLMNGIDTTIFIRNSLKITAPILALTANTIKSKVDEYITVGMNDFISKPFEESILKQKIYAQLSEKKNNTPNQEPKLNMKNLEELARNNQDFIKKMLSIFLKEGKETLSILENNPSQDRSMIAHKIKPSLDILGYPKIQKLVREIENENDVNFSLFLHELKTLLHEVEQKLA